MIHVVGDSHIMLFTGQLLSPTKIFDLKVPENYKSHGSAYDLYPSFSTYFCVLLRAYHIVPGTNNPQSGAFFKTVGTLSKGSTVLIVAGEIDCRGPVMNVAHRTGISISDVATECAQRYLIGIRLIKEMGFNPILYSPTPNKFVQNRVEAMFNIPDYLTPEIWCRNKEEAVKIFDSTIKTSEFPVVSLVDWIFKEDIIYKKEYWCDQIHMSSAVWPQLKHEFSKIGVDLSEFFNNF